MTMTLNPGSIGTLASLAPSHRTTAAGNSPAGKAAMKGLADALGGTDLQAARKAYSAAVRTAAPGTPLDRNSVMAQVGRALRSGDMDAARAALTATTAAAAKPKPVPMPPTPAPAPIASLPAVPKTALSVDTARAAPGSFGQDGMVFRVDLMA